MERRWPLTGRDVELRKVAAAVRPGAAGIVVAGSAGAGKTRLAREALAAAGRRGARVLWVHGSATSRPLPLGAFAGLAGVPPAEGVAAVVAAIGALAGQGRVVLAVDDAHQLDQLSAMVVDRVVDRGAAPVLLTVRHGVPAPDLVTSLSAGDSLARLDLLPLDASSTAALIARVLAGPVETRSAHRLWALTEGNPLYLRHLLPGEVGSGRLRPVSGLWCWSEAPRITPGLLALLERDMGNLSGGVRDVVDLLAVAEPVTVDRLTRLVDADEVEAAESRGLVRTGTRDDRLVARLAHPLYGEVRRASMGVVRARRLRGRVAVTLDPVADTMERAVLALDSDLPADTELFRRAAEQALGLYDVALAERLARAAAGTGDLQAALVRASALSWLSRGREADELLADLARAVPEPGRSLAQAYRAGNLGWTLGEPQRGRALLARAMGDADPQSKVLLEALDIALEVSMGGVRTALPRALALYGSGLPAGLARLVVTSALAAAGAVSGRLSLVDMSLEPASTGIPAFGRADFQVLAARLAGLPSRAADAAAPLVAASSDLPGPARLMGLVLAGHAELAAGRVVDALVPLREAWTGLEASAHEFRFRCRTLLALAVALTGQGDAARPLLDGLAQEQHPAYRLFAPDDLLARAWGAAALGATTEAGRLAEQAADLACDQDWPAFEVLCWQTATQLGASARAVGRLSALTATVEGPRVSAVLGYARASAAGDAELLLEASVALEHVGDLVAAGDAAAQASTLLRRGARRGSALAAGARAQQLAAASGARTPALLAAVVPLPLTAREREVAVLAAGGMSNRHIAERLAVSVRTVEGHLYRAAHKLGVSDRGELAGLLSVPGPAGPARI